MAGRGHVLVGKPCARRLVHVCERQRQTNIARTNLDTMNDGKRTGSASLKKRNRILRLSADGLGAHSHNILS
jgi:hypothetical protein